MQRNRVRGVDVPASLLEEIRTFPVKREIEHCSHTICVSPFDFYAECPQCHVRIKIRSFAGAPEMEDIFDAVFTWMNQPGAEEIARRRQQAIKPKLAVRFSRFPRQDKDLGRFRASICSQEYFRHALPLRASVPKIAV